MRVMVKMTLRIRRRVHALLWLQWRCLHKKRVLCNCIVLFGSVYFIFVLCFLSSFCRYPAHDDETDKKSGKDTIQLEKHGMSFVVFVWFIFIVLVFIMFLGLLF
jgi:uncharacterized protein YqhQ